MLVIPGWVSHIDYDLLRPEICSFYQRLACGRRLIRYDKRGCGLSDRTAEASALGVDAQVEDAVAVLDAAGVRRVAVLAWSAGGPVALPWPRVTRSGFPALSFTARTRGSWPPPITRAGSHLRWSRACACWCWRNGAWAHGCWRMSSSPKTDPGFATWFTGYLRPASSAEVAADLLWAVAESDVRVLLPVIGVPVLVIHRRDDCKVDYRAGSYLAEHLPRARLELLEGVDHLPYRGDSQAVTDAVDRFLCSADPEHRPSRALLEPQRMRRTAAGCRRPA